MNAVPVWFDTPHIGPNGMFDAAEPVGSQRRPEVLIPDGWHRVHHGETKPGDLCLDKYAMQATGKITWVPVNDPITDLTAHRIIRKAQRDILSYCCVIRQGPMPKKQEPCERCRAFGRHKKDRYCIWCSSLLTYNYRKEHDGD